jgi:steroid delta-isomerase-like uncharacterized protein
MPDTAKNLVRRLFEAFNTGNISALDDLIATNYIYREPTLGERRGPTGYKDIVHTYRTAFPDANITVNEQFVDGNTVTSRWTATGTHNGPLMGIPPTGRHVSVQGLLITKVQNGKIVEEFECFDTLGMLRQIGAVPTALGKAA